MKYEKIRHKWVEQAKEEAYLNLHDEELEKCLKALEAWEKNVNRIQRRKNEHN